MNTNICMKSVSELKGFRFTIPNYQRGYRWTKQQVKELLDDVWGFSQEQTSPIYCIQPLVVCEKKNREKDLTTWEVIDGQQRLTTISIIMQMLGQCAAPFSISYDTLNGKEEKINNIVSLSTDDANSDINFHFMVEAKETVRDWIGKLKEDDRRLMSETIWNRVKFIWYNTDEETPIRVFTRLNVGRIALTSSELIKALFLNRENFKGNNDELIRAKQIQIAQEWDRIENQLQDDAFWLFLRNLNNEHKDSWNKPTRIDFLLDFVCKQEIIKKLNKKIELSYDIAVVGDDNYRTFRIYYEFYNKSPKGEFLEFWKYVKEVYDIWCEWYNDPSLYHYVGFTLAEVDKITLTNLVLEWFDKTRSQFNDYLFGVIKSHLKIKKCNNLERNYLEGGKDNKRSCIPLLLLHNVVTIVRQNEILSNNEQYLLGVFYKFPFHLYKIEHWDVEHIDSATKNELKELDSQKNWILSAYQFLNEEQKKTYKDKLCSFFGEDKDEANIIKVTFEELYSDLSKELNLSDYSGRKWKNMVQNFVLLDSATNRSYHNAIFPDKRAHILGKEKGIHMIAYWDKDQNEIALKEESFKSAFVPICTRNVFQKAYSSMQGNPTLWDETDAEAYKNEIMNTLKDFL